MSQAEGCGLCRPRAVFLLAGIWRLVVDERGGVAHIWFLRQLTREEKKHRVRAAPGRLARIVSSHDNEGQGPA